MVYHAPALYHLPHIPYPRQPFHLFTVCEFTLPFRRSTNPMETVTLIERCRKRAADRAANATNGAEEMLNQPQGY